MEFRRSAIAMVITCALGGAATLAQAQQGGQATRDKGAVAELRKESRDVSQAAREAAIRARGRGDEGMTPIEQESRRVSEAARQAAIDARKAGGATAASGNIAPSARQSSIYRRDTGIDDSGQYASEVRACMSGQTQQDRETCLQEARNAQAARRGGELRKEGENYAANALARCQPLSGEYQAACEARVMGFGSTSGTVAGGGLLRQVETVVLPPEADRVRIQPQTENPVLLVPRTSR